MSSLRFVLFAVVAAGCARSATPVARPAAEPLHLCDRFDCVPASMTTPTTDAMPPVRVDINLSSPAARRANLAG